MTEIKDLIELNAAIAAAQAEAIRIVTDRLGEMPMDQAWACIKSDPALSAPIRAAQNAMMVAGRQYAEAEGITLAEVADRIRAAA